MTRLLCEVDSFKSSSEMKSHALSEVDFLLFYAQNERNLGEFDIPDMVRGVGFEPTSVRTKLLSFGSF